MPITETPIYHIRVQGRLDPSWSDWLGGLQIVSQTDAETLFKGPIVDQAALHGILDRLYALNLPIVLVMQLKSERVEDTDSPEAQRHQADCLT